MVELVGKSLTFLVFGEDNAVACVSVQGVAVVHGLPFGLREQPAEGVVEGVPHELPGLIALEEQPVVETDGHLG